MPPPLAPRSPQPERPSRSVLAVPASNWRMIEKGVGGDADLVFLDLEDAVAPAEKVASRANIVRACTELEWGQKPRFYRVNGLDTPLFYRDLIDVIEQSRGAVDLVMLPKCGSAADVHVLTTLLGQIEAAVGREGAIGIEVQIESAAGLLAAPQIAASSPRIEGLVFGPGDYAASVGMPVAAIGTEDNWDAAYPGHRFHSVMHGLLVAARAAGVRMVDGPYANFRDLDGLRRSALRARALGYDGKWCIHPAQIPVVNEVFSPSADEIDWSERVIAAAEDAAAQGRGALQIDGVMIDAASVQLAARALRRSGRDRAPR